MEEVMLSSRDAQMCGTVPGSVGEGRICVEMNFERLFPMRVQEGAADLLHH